MTQKGTKGFQADPLFQRSSSLSPSPSPSAGTGSLPPEPLSEPLCDRKEKAEVGSGVSHE